MTTMGKKALAVILSVALLVSTASVALFVFAGEGDTELTLAQWIEEADKLTEDTYVEGWDDFDTALTAAKAVEEDAAQADKDAAVAALKTAWQGLKKEEYVKLADPQSADVTLKDATEADGLPMGTQLLDVELDVPQKLIEWKNFSISASDYYAILYYAKVTGKKSGNPKGTMAINGKYKDAQEEEHEGKLTDDWPWVGENSWFEYKKPLADIKEGILSVTYVKFENAFTSQDNTDELICDSFQVSALYGVKLVGEPLPQPSAPQVDPISDVALSEWVAQGKLIPSDGIDATVWGKFEAALTAAETLAADENATQSEINDAILLLKATWKSLKKVEYTKLGDPTSEVFDDAVDAAPADKLPAGAKVMTVDWDLGKSTVMGWDITDPTDITGFSKIVFFMDPPDGYDRDTNGKKLIMNFGLVKTLEDGTTKEISGDAYPDIWWTDMHEYGIFEDSHGWGADQSLFLENATAIKYASLKNFGDPDVLWCDGFKVSSLFGYKETKFPTPEDPVDSDKSALKALLTKADTFKAKDFLSSTFVPFTEAVTAAKEVVANDRASQVVVDAAKTALLEAWGKLRFIVDSAVFLDYDQDVDEPVLIDEMANATYLIKPGTDYPIGTSILQFLDYEDNGNWGQMQFQNGDNMDMDGYDALELYVKRDGLTKGGKLMMQIFTANGHYDYNLILEPGTDTTWATKLQLSAKQFETFVEENGEWVGNACSDEEFASIGSFGFAYLDGMAGKLSISSINKVKTIAVAAGELPNPNGGGDDDTTTTAPDDDDTTTAPDEDGDVTTAPDGGDGDDTTTTAVGGEDADDGDDDGDDVDSSKTGDAGLPLAIAGLALLSGAAIVYTMKKSRA